MPIRKWSSLPNRVVSNTNLILELLRKHNKKAIFYILGWIAEQYPDLIVQISKEGHQIGYHSYYHQTLDNQNEEEFEQDLIKGLSLLENIIEKRIVHYRAPQFSLNMNSLYAIPILLKHGIKVSSSIKSGVKIFNNTIPNKPFCFEYNNQKLIELPLSKANLFGQGIVYSGSGYIRILPKKLITRLYRKSDYTLTYFHPRDFDTSVPIAKELGFARNLLNRIGNSSTATKLEMLLNNFEFLPPNQIQTLFTSQCLSNEIPTISLDEHFLH